MSSTDYRASAKIIGIIPARYGSSRFPGKPLALICGKTLIQHTFENAKKCSFFSSLLVATDDQRIFDHVVSFGADVMMTSSDCLTGTDRIVEVLKKLPLKEQPEIVVNIQGDEPCIEEEVLLKVIQILQQDSAAVMSTAVMPLESEQEALSPSVVKCTFDINQNALFFSRGLIPSGPTGRFQKGQKYFHHLGIYAYKRDFLVNEYPKLSETSLQKAEDLEQLKILESGFRIKVAVVNSQNVGVNHPEDIHKLTQKLAFGERENSRG